MLLTLLAACLLGTPTSEPQSGRPLREGCRGLVNCILLLHEEYYLRIGECFSGKVIAIEDDTITVQRWRSVARVFRVSPSLASDRIPLPQRLGTGHRLRQLCVGDMVGVDVTNARDGYVCIALGIYRRPGEIIPEAADDHLPERSRLHVRCNAEQFIEEILVPAFRNLKLPFALK